MSVLIMNNSKGTQAIACNETLRKALEKPIIFTQGSTDAEAHRTLDATRNAPPQTSFSSSDQHEKIVKNEVNQQTFDVLTIVATALGQMKFGEEMRTKTNSTGVRQTSSTPGSPLHTPHVCYSPKSSPRCHPYERSVSRRDFSSLERVAHARNRKQRGLSRESLPAAVVNTQTDGEIVDYSSDSCVEVLSRVGKPKRINELINFEFTGSDRSVQFIRRKLHSRRLNQSLWMHTESL